MLTYATVSGLNLAECETVEEQRRKSRPTWNARRSKQVPSAMLARLRNHPIRWIAGSAVTLAALAWVAFGYFGVHTLFIDDVVAESAPVFDGPAPTPVDGVVTSAEAPSPPPADAPRPQSDEPPATEDRDVTADSPATTPATTQTVATPATVALDTTNEVVAEYSGTFVGDAHATSGTAVVLGNGTDQRFLRFEEFETSNGPDLNVYLVNSSTGDVSDFVDLGDLKGNIGSQNYEIPAGVDLDVYDQVSIWCVRFRVSFGNAPLEVA